MTINATAAWLLALYVAVAERRGVDRAAARGHDAERHHQGVPVARHVHLPAGAVAAPDQRHGRATPSSTSRSGTRSTSAATTCRKPARRRCRRSRSRSPTRSACSTRCAPPARLRPADFPQVVGRISFFVNAGIRFIEEMCKLRAFTRSGTRSAASATASTDEKLRRFRYGVQVNSLGLTEAQPENNVQRIVLEMLAVVLSKDARARSVQLPAWNEALGLPRPWDQQWSLRIQQIIAYETDLLEYADLFDGSPVDRAQGRGAASRARAKSSPRSRRWAARSPPSRTPTEAAAGRVERAAPAPRSSPASRSSSA